MSKAAHGPRSEPFFLSASRGERFCILHRPAMPPRATVLYLHPFAEELNKSRRMAALQARALAEVAFAVLQIDLFGCGDSGGDFRDASWDVWLRDVDLAVKWLRGHYGVPVLLWGLRLGSLMACDYALQSGGDIESLLLWQPVLNGEQMLTQFFRMRMASEMLTSGAAKSGTQALRDQCYAGNVLEIAGYGLSPALVRAIDQLRLANLVPRKIPVFWIEVVPETGRSLSPAVTRVTDRWEEAGVDLSTHHVVGEPFWTTQEISECPALVAASCELLTKAPHGI